MGLEDVVKRMKAEASGVVISKALPNGSSFKVIGTLNLSSGIEDSFLMGSLDKHKPLFPEVYNSASSVLEEFMECIPIGDKEMSEETILIPYLTDRFVVGSVRFGRKVEQVPYNAAIVTYRKGPKSAILYTGRSAVVEEGRTHFAVRIKISAPEKLAEEFMRLAQMRPNDLWKLLSDGLFPGVFSTEQEFSYRNGNYFYTKMAVPAPVRKTGKMYFRDLSPQQLKNAGLEFNTPYLSMNDRSYSRISAIQRASARNNYRSLQQSQTQNPQVYALFNALQEKGIKPQPPLHADVTEQRSIINATLLPYTPS